MVRTYLYGIIEATNQANLGITGIDGASPVHVVTGDSLGCVVSGYAGEEFGNLPKEEVLRKLFAHQEVIEGAMERRHTVLPVKFGTLLDRAQDALDLLSQGHQQFVGALASINDKIEMEVAATWDTSRVLQDMSNEDEVVRAKEAIARKGQPTVEDRVRLGQVVKACMDRRRDSYRERMVEFLGHQAVDVASNALVTDEMVMNVAFLVERARQNEFDSAVHQLDSLFKNQVTFRVIGPLPPYSFTTVEVTRLSSAQIDEALRTLGLGDVASEGAIRNAYRRLAAQSQRAPKPGNESAHHLVSLRQASDLLLRYQGARKEDQRGEGEHALAGHDTDGLFTIIVRRSESQEVEATQFGAVEAR